MTKQRLQLTWYNKDKALIPTETGKYGYAWVEADDPRYCETHTLVMDEHIEGVQTPKSDDKQYSERADLEPQSDNLLIRGESGDVLEALTRVPELAKKYVGQVKLIYIDPPFNTEKTFDSYEDNLEHSVWLTLMRDRLFNLKQLLAPCGTIWIHLNEDECHRMRLVLDEQFGANNFIAEFVWQRKTSSQSDTSLISLDTDFILCYAQDKSTVSFNGLSRTAASESAYDNPDNDPRGPWRESDYKMKSGALYPIIHPKSGEEIYPPEGTMWRYSQATHERNLAENRLYWGKTNDYRYPKFKRFRSEVADTRIPNNLLLGEDCDTTRRAKQHLKELFDSGDIFATPKPERLLERIIHIASNPGDIVLDCFAGSATTAAVAQKMGRRWVTCELLESNYSTYDVPRLTKVVNDQDPGGITQTKPERVAADGVELPDGVSPDDAAKFTSVLNKLIADDSELKKDKAVKTLKKLAKTKNAKPVINWRGGGGFQLAHLSPACFDYDPEVGLVTLTDAAHGDTLVASICANRGFARLGDDSVFDGVKGSTYLKVYEGIADAALVDSLLSQLSDEDRLVIAATSVKDGTREYLRKARRGSRVLRIPDEIFPFTGGEE